VAPISVVVGSSEQPDRFHRGEGLAQYGECERSETNRSEADFPCPRSGCWLAVGLQYLTIIAQLMEQY